MKFFASRDRSCGRLPRPWTLPVAGAVALLMLGPSQVLAQRQTGTKAAPTTTLSPALADQIASLEAEKDARTPAQQKMDSQLIYAAKMYRGQPITAAVPTLEVNVPINADGTVLVDIDGTVSNPELQEVLQLGGQIIVSVPEYGSIRALLPLTQVETLAADPNVRFIRPAAIAQLRGHGPIPPSGLTPLSPAIKAAHVRTALPGLLSQIRARHAERTAPPLPALGLPSFNSFFSLGGLVQANRVLLGGLAPISAGGSFGLPAGGGTFDGPGDGPTTNAINGSNPEEGYVAHRANLAFSTYGVTGGGIKIGVLSDSAGSSGTGTTLATATANGYVSPVTVIQDTSGSNEGLAMLEIVHALAPGATLYFATGNISEASYASNIQALRNAGCDIILDDLGYLDESPFQDGIVAQAVRNVTNAGALYFSSAGNQGNKDSGNSTVWEGDYNPSTFLYQGTTYPAHTFGTSIYNTANVAYGQSLSVSLFWSDPLGKSNNDYDLYVVDSTNTIVAGSANTQSGSQNPFEITSVTNGQRLLVIKSSAAAARFLHLNMSADEGVSNLQFSTTGQTAGHNAVDTVGMYGVAAASAQGRTTPFNTASLFENFTSDGPRHVFYNVDGSQITPGNVSSTGGSIRLKPDITAADKVGTAVNGFNPFGGTSAAAPHAGAIAALLKSYNPSLTQSQIRSIFTGPAAIDIGAAGYDRDTGYGIVDAFNAVTYGNTVSGTVTASNGTPISGVTFTVTGQAATATTDATGAYTLSPLPVGTLTITPSKAGFNFVPASQTVTVGASQPNGTAGFALSQAGIRTSVSSVTLSGSTLSVTILLANGGSNVTGATLTRATLGASAAPSSPTVPSTVGSITTGSAATVTLTFPRSAGASGATVPLRISGTVAGNGSFSGSFQVVLP